MAFAELIAERIQTLDGGTFEALASRYVLNRYQLESWHESGLKAGTTKPVKGPNDAFGWSASLGGWVVCESGHVTGHAQAIRKMKNDAAKCIKDAAAQGIDGQLVKIVLAHSCPAIDLKGAASIKAIDGRIELLGIDELAQGCLTYPWLAKDYLGIDTGHLGLTDLDGFLRRYAVAPHTSTLLNPLVGREEELGAVIRALEGDRVVAILGSAGTGKTRLAVESAKKWYSQNRCPALFLTTSYEGVAEQLELFRNAHSAFCLVVDDANEVSCLDAVVEFLARHPEVRVILTVRSYAWRSVRDAFAKAVPVRECQLSAMTLSQATEVVEKVHAVPPEVSAQIARLAGGNLRLASLACRVYSECPGRPLPAADLIEYCYGSLDFLSDEERKAGLVASVLGRHRTEANLDLDALLFASGLAADEYLDACRSLHDRELLDCVQALTAVDFSEQPLRDYLVYRALVADRRIKLADLWALPSGSKVLYRCVSSTYQYLDAESRPWFEDQLEDVWKLVPEEGRLEFVRQYNELLGVNGVLYLKGLATELPARDADFELRPVSNGYRGILKGSVVDALAPFLSELSRHRHSAEDILWDLMEKGYVCQEDVNELFQRMMGITRTSAAFGFQRQKELVARLVSKVALPHPLRWCALCALSRSVFADDIDEFCMTDGQTCTFVYGDLPHSDALIDLRIETLRALREMAPNEEALELILAELVGMRRGRGRQLTRETCRVLVEEALPALALRNIESCRALMHLRRVCETHGVPCSEIDDRLAGDSVATLICVLAEQRTWRFDSHDVGDEVAALAEADWIRLFETMTPGMAGAELSLWQRLGMALEALGHFDHWDVVLREWPARGLPATNAVGDRVCASLLEEWDPAGAREELLDQVPREMQAAWAAQFDRLAANGDDSDVIADLVLASVGELGEVLPLEAVRKIGSQDASFVLRYIRELAKCSSIDGLLASDFFGAYTEEQLIEVAASFDEPELDAVEDLVRSLTGRNHGDHFLCLMAFLEEVRPGFTVRAFESLVRANAGRKGLEHDTYGAYDSFGEAFWGAKSGLRLFPEVLAEGARLAEERDFAFDAVCLMSAIVRQGTVEEETRNVVVSVLVDAALAGNPLSRFAVKMVTDLPAGSRLECVAAAARGGIDGRAFEDLAFGWPVTQGLSWSGSEMPLFAQGFDYVDAIQEQLNPLGRGELELVCEEFRRGLRRRRAQVEVDEFLDGGLLG